jgi:hypothetical protein
MYVMQHRADMANSNKEKEAFATRRKTYLEQDFDPGYYPSSMPLDIRLSRAAEYARLSAWPNQSKARSAC